MPIKGLTTETDFGAGLPMIAKLFKGDKKEVENRPGKDLDYFRVEFEPQFEHLKPQWVELYGEEPTEFHNVYLAAATVDEAFDSWKEEWNKSQTLLHRCDGENQVMWWSDTAQFYMKAKVPCLSPADPKTGLIAEPKCDCKNTGRLKLMLLDFIEVAGVMGYISATTHSINDILTVYRYLADIQRIYGKLNGVPFVFGRAGKEVSAPKQVKRNGEYVRDGRIKVNKSLFYVHVEADFTLQQLLPAMANPAPALPATIDTVKELELAKGRLGTGNKPRILGREPEAPKLPGKAADHWTLNPTRVEKFLNWCLDKLSLEAPVVLDALRRVQPDVAAVFDWRGSEIDALAAVIATAAGDDEDAIEQITSSPSLFKEETGFEVYNAALNLIQVLVKATA